MKMREERSWTGEQRPCRSLVLNMMGEMGRISEEKHCRDMVTEIVEKTWREGETRRMVSEFLGVSGDIQNAVEKR